MDRTVLRRIQKTRPYQDENKSAPLLIVYASCGAGISAGSRLSRRLFPIMMIIMRKSLTLLLLSATLFAAAPQVGQMAPDFTLPSQDGSKVSLHDFRSE